MGQMRCAGFVFAVLGSVSANALADPLPVYRFVDDSGVVQYTDKEPRGRTFTVVNRPRQPPAGTAEIQMASDPAPIDTDPASAAAAGTPAANCALVRRNIEVFENSATVNLDRDGDGNAETLDADARAQELARFRTLETAYCDQPV